MKPRDERIANTARAVTFRTLVTAAMACLGGCYAHAQPVGYEPVGYAVVTSAPIGIEGAPYVNYEGRPYYYYSNHWYYQDAGRWWYLPQEPPALYRRRPYVQQAPPAPRSYVPGYGPGYAPGYAPPAPAPAPAPPPVPPPAVRVR